MLIRTTASKSINLFALLHGLSLQAGLVVAQDGDAFGDLSRRAMTFPDLAHRGNGLSSANSNVVLADRQRWVIQVVVTCMSSLSITASIVALYWFCMMRRNYRRDLVLFLILSDCFKNFNYILFSGVESSTPRGVQTSDTFCQASGYLLQTGLSACDFAVLFISLHMALQIFPLPNTILGYDGLYNVRHWVLAIWIILPNLTASLAFINSDYAYLVQGAWCWLPVRPFWYRLALSWIPRYIITLLIFSFAVIIYAYVGAEFRIFRRERDRASSLDFTSPTLTSSDVPATTQTSDRGQASFTPQSTQIDNSTEARSRTASFVLGPTTQQLVRTLTNDEHEGRRQSMPSFNSPFANSAEDMYVTRGTRSAAGSRRGSKQVAFSGLPEIQEPEPLSPRQQPIQPASITAIAEAQNLPDSPELSPSADLEALPEIEQAQTLGSTTNAMDEALKSRRKAIKRQVRGLFVYPVAYISFWIIPFVMHCMNYSDYYALHPVFAISLLSSFCTSTLGLVDASIFCFREQPWRHIVGSDGTFIGSFMFWKFLPRRKWRRRPSMLQDLIREKETEENSSGIISFIRNSWRRLSSSASPSSPSSGRHSVIPFRSSGVSRGVSGRRMRENEIAQERLRRERQDFSQRQASMDEPTSATTQKSTGSRNWFDRALDMDDDEEAGLATK